jgi:hypothetical protein
VHHPELGNIVSANNLVRIKGLAIHELSHLLFTPRSRTHLPKVVAQRNQGATFNILEDNRIENFMVSRMSGVKPWLVHTITTELVNNNSLTSDLLPLLWGRKYMPEPVRKSAYAAWVQKFGADSAKEVARILDEYIVLTLHDKTELETAERLVGELHRLLLDANASVSSPNHYKESSSAPESDGSKPLGKKETTPAKQDVEKALRQESSQQDDDDTGDTDDEDGTGSSKPGDSSGDPASDLKQQLSQAHESARDDIYKDIKSTIEAIKSPEGEASFAEDSDLKRFKREIVPASKWAVQHEHVSDEARNMANAFTRELVHIKAEFDPAWVRKSSQGRLNVREYMLGADFDEAFDLWDQGHEEATDIECVILLDNSGSMQDLITPAYEAMWATKRSLDAVDASTTVIQYGTWGNYLYQAHEKASGKMLTARREGGGSTNPLNSLIKASEILSSSSRAIKMMIVITDGQWGNSGACDQVIATMRNQGVVTGLVYLQSPDLHEVFISRDDSGNQLVDAHFCEASVMLTEPRKIVEFAKKLAKVSRERVLTR